MAVTTSYDTWNFTNHRVAQEATGGQFVSAETTLIAAGPPVLDTPNQYNVGAKVGEAEAYPIGLLESFGLQQNRQLQRIFEIGSSRSYFIPGRTVGTFALGRTFYYGPSLLRVLYAYYKNEDSTTGIYVGASAPGSTVTQASKHNAPDPNARLVTAGEDALHKLRRNPGYGYFTMDLASDLFAQPFGMAVYFKDINNNTLGAFYLQECYVQGHQLSVNSGSVLIMEGAQAQYDQLIPIKMDLSKNAAV